MSQNDERDTSTNKPMESDPSLGDANEPTAERQSRTVARRAFIGQTAAVGAAALAALSAASEAHAQPAGSKINSTRDWMLFTDKSRTGGVLCTGEASLAVTSAFVQGFEATYFNKDWKWAPTPKDLRAKATGLEGASGQVSAARLDKAVEELAAATGVFTVSATAQALTALSTKTDRAPGQLTLNGKKVWRPGGEIMTRQAGSANVTFIVGPQDLRGALTPSTRLGAVGLIAGRPGITAAGDGCGVCGTCGLCGFCVLCGEVNAGTIGAIAAEAINITSASSVVFSPTALDPITNKFPTGVRDLQLASQDLRNSLARFSTAVTKVRGT